ncbi:MAG: helix-turn-helix domain-containing protein [Pseudomonas sp.]|uniref:helix-turn-helix domain-containing protein n=1 Tax=Pseudomonas sp. TaxID=306 RepID=UPI00391C6D58
MAPTAATSLCSFADIDPYAIGPKSEPLHPPPPRLPEGVAARGGRHEPDLLAPFETPAFVENLLIIHLRFPKRLSIKLDRWIHADSMPGDLTLIPRGQSCTWDGGGAGEALILSLPPELSNKTALLEANFALAQVEFMPRIGHTDPLAHAIAQAILSELQTEGLFGMLYMESLLRTLTLHLLRNYAVFTPKQTAVKGTLPADALRQVCDYVHDHLGEEITLEALAAQVHLSPYHFARQFKEATGLPPYQYVLQCRVEQAKTLLTAGKHSISEVAQNVGFASQSHLTRHIKNAYGVTPSALLPVGKNRQT